MENSIYNGFCPQHNVLVDELTGFELLEPLGKMCGMKWGEIDEQGDDLLSVAALLDKNTHQVKQVFRGRETIAQLCVGLFGEVFIYCVSSLTTWRKLARSGAGLRLWCKDR